MWIALAGYELHPSAPKPVVLLWLYVMNLAHACSSVEMQPAVTCAANTCHHRPASA